MCDSQGPRLRKVRQEEDDQDGGRWDSPPCQEWLKTQRPQVRGPGAEETATVTFSVSAKGSPPLPGYEPLEVTFIADAQRHTRGHTQCLSMDTGSTPLLGTPDTQSPQASLSLYKSQDYQDQKALTQVSENQSLSLACLLSKKKTKKLVFKKFLMCVAQQRRNSIIAFK